MVSLLIITALRCNLTFSLKVNVEFSLMLQRGFLRNSTETVLTMSMTSNRQMYKKESRTIVQHRLATTINIAPDESETNREVALFIAI